MPLLECTPFSDLRGRRKIEAGNVRKDGTFTGFLAPSTAATPCHHPARQSGPSAPSSVEKIGSCVPLTTNIGCY